jgi:hypothetical protein
MELENKHVEQLEYPQIMKRGKKKKKRKGQLE